MAQVTILNNMASKEISESLDIQKSWGIKTLDLKDNIFGKSIEDLSVSEAEQVKQLVKSRNLAVNCLSTIIFQDGIEEGEKAYKDQHMASIDRIIQVADVLKPTLVRILPTRIKEFKESGELTKSTFEKYPWLCGLYQEAIDKLHAAGHKVVIENEKYSFLSSPDDILYFFQAVDREGKIHLTYDVQNLWIMGTYPTLDIYNQLKSFIAYYHVKGGQENPETKMLQWKSSLEDATWPIYETTQKVIEESKSQVICINPCYGELKDNYDYDNMTKRDVEYLQKMIKKIKH